MTKHILIYELTTSDPYPRILISRNKSNPKDRYFGPYPSIGSTKYISKILHDLFPIRDCKQDITIDTLQPKCINLDLGKCIGPCVKKDTLSEYKDLINQLILFLKGENNSLLKNMTAKMLEYSKKLEFEKANEYKHRIQKLTQLISRQTVEFSKSFDGIIWVINDTEQLFYSLIQVFQTGKLISQNGNYISKSENEDLLLFLSTCLDNYIDIHKPKKIEIITNSESESAINQLAPFYESPLYLSTPKQGHKKQLLKIAELNLKSSIQHLSTTTIPYSSNLFNDLQLKISAVF